MTHFILSGLGSYGDVHPVVGLGAALARRGHHVHIVTNPYFADVVTDAGLTLLPIGTRDEYIEMSRHADLWHPLWGPRMILSQMARGIRPLYDLVVSHYRPGETVYGAHGLDLASRVAGEKLGAPVASINFAPGMFWSEYDSPRLKGALLGPRVPKWLKRLQFWFADEIVSERLWGRELNGLRAELGLPPARRIFSRWLHATDLVLGLFPEWFGPPQPDWPANTRAVGFPLWDAPGSVPNSHSTGIAHETAFRELGTDPFASELDTEVADFLAAGPPPIAFSPGSANNAAHHFFAAAVDACQRLGRRGILLTKYDHQLPANRPDTVRHFGFIPLSKLLPHTAALVQHGGIGSCAQGLAAGVPQLVQPMSYDQFDNSRRLVQLGVAREIPVRRFDGPTVAAALTSLVESPSVKATCRDLAARCDGPKSLAAACDAMESLANLRFVTKT